MKIKILLWLGILVVVVAFAVLTSNQQFIQGIAFKFPFSKKSPIPSITVSQISNAKKCTLYKDACKKGDQTACKAYNSSINRCVASTSVQPSVPYGHCIPVVNNGHVNTNYNFIIAFYGLDSQEFNTKAYDYTRAQFYRSQYDIGNKTDPNYGFSTYSTATYGPNNYTARLGLFEMEPYKTYISKFNVFYIDHQFDDSTNPFTQATTECPFLTESKNMVIVLKHQNSPWPQYGAWNIEEMGDTFIHEIGHTFGLYDEYFTDMTKNNLSVSGITDWNMRIPNCDYNHPVNSEDYQTGRGYCTKWCQGVNQTVYQTYKTQRDQYDLCEFQLLNKTNLQSWMNYCTNTLNFSKKGYQLNMYNDDTGWTSHNTIDEACQNVYLNNPTTSTHYNANIQRFCFGGTLFNIWDLDIGKSCQTGTGCFVGCGGFGRDLYSGRPIGAFGDAFRPESLSVMGGAPLNDSGQYALRDAHINDNLLPNYGIYDTQVIINKWKQLGLVP